MLIDGLQQFFGREPDQEAVGPADPADGAAAIDKHCRRSVGVLTAGTMTFIDDRQGVRHLVVDVGDDLQVWEGVLSFLGVLQVIPRNGDEANVSRDKIRMMLFELAELDHANHSPMAAEENHDRGLTILQILSRERTAVGERGRESG